MRILHTYLEELSFLTLPQVSNLDNGDEFQRERQIDYEWTGSE